jgi:hypothetical protein
VSPRYYDDSDIIKVIAKIQREHGFDFGIAPPGRSPECALRDIVAMSNQLCDALPGVDQRRLLRCLVQANDQEAKGVAWQAMH